MGVVRKPIEIGHREWMVTLEVHAADLEDEDRGTVLASPQVEWKTSKLGTQLQPLCILLVNQEG